MKKADIKEFIDWITLKDLRQGLMLTFRYLFSKQITRYYPYEKLVASKRWHGFHQLWLYGNEKERCIGCCLCERICPNRSIKIVSGRAADGGKEVVDFIIDGGRCLYCGFCEEVCPVKAIRLSGEYAMKAYKREDLVFHKKQLLERGGQD